MASSHSTDYGATRQMFFSWGKRCCHCKQVKALSEFHKRKPCRQRPDGYDTECSQCCNIRKRRNRSRRHQTPHGKWKVLARAAEKRSRKIGCECTIDAKFLEHLYGQQNEKCALSKLPFEFAKHPAYIRHPRGPSVDRIDCHKGYTPDNVRLVLWAVNNAIADYGLNEFLPIARALVSCG